MGGVEEETVQENRFCEAFRKTTFAIRSAERQEFVRSMKLRGL